jgi:hypothetical protein
VIGVERMSRNWMDANSKGRKPVDEERLGAIVLAFHRQNPELH